MQFDISKVKTTISISLNTVEEGAFGYFSNNLEYLKKAVEKERSNLNTVYCKLEYCLDEKYERRFGTEVGHFSLFYPLDKELNELRY